MGTGAPVYILHGLFGSIRNWSGIANQLSNSHEVTVFDLRNHGDSPHVDAMDYPTMAADILHHADQMGHERFALIGHSMGGKVAMTVSTLAHQRLSSLIVVDIAPTTYSDRFTTFIEAMRVVPSDPQATRADIERALAPVVTDRSVRLFLLQSYRRDEAGYRWQFNLEAIAKAMDALMGFPETPTPISDATNIALITGGPTSMVPNQDARDLFLRKFPKAAIMSMPECGHWPHIDEPDGFSGSRPRLPFKGSKHITAACFTAVRLAGKMFPLLVFHPFTI